MKISTLTDHIFTPSSRFRVRQYIDPLESYGIFVNDLERKNSIQLVADGYTSIKKSPYLVYKALLQEFLDVSNTFSSKGCSVFLGFFCLSLFSVLSLI